MSEFSTAFYRKRKKGVYSEVEAPILGASVADTHAHLDMLKDPAANLARCACHGVTFVCAMCDLVEDSTTTYDRLEIWRSEAEALLREGGYAESVSRVPRLRVAIGCHPHNAKDYTDEVENVLLQRLRDPRTCALGEVGLDYHYDFSPREVQREVFRRQIRIAHKTGLPLILHMREAHDEGFSILKEEGFPEAGVLLHCCNIDPEALAPWIQADCYVAYGGPLTFKKADEVRAGAQTVPLDRLLTETDSPYMTPEPMRGMTCGPEHTIFTAAKMCDVLMCETPSARDDMLHCLYDNALRVLDHEPTAWQNAEK